MRILLDELSRADNLQELDLVTKKAIDFIRDPGNRDYGKAAVRKAIHDKVDSLIESSKEMITKTDEVLKYCRS